MSASAAALPADGEGGGESFEEIKVPDSMDGVDLTKSYKPPPHVNAGGVYSNAYRKALAEKKSLDEAKIHAKKASAIFQKFRVVTPEMCGKFMAKPRAKKASAPKVPVAKEGNGEDGKEEEGEVEAAISS